ncbi:flagella basal body P-ring formation protein FlgA [Massilia sp. PDC64]|nr:flagella basal body P-ring formation protein FlgA [Massilia sp. PDC64]
MRRCVLAPSLLLCAAAHAAPVALDLRPAALVHGKTVLLGDVAGIDAPPATAARLAALQVAAAPLPGYPETLSRAALEAALLAQPVFQDVVPAWRGAERVEVRRAGAAIDGADIAAAARRMLEAAYGNRYAKLELTPVGTVRDVQVPEGLLALRPRAAAALHARTTVWVDVLVDGAVVRSATVPFQVRAWNPVWVARRPLPADAPLAQGDFRSELQDVLGLAAAPAAPTDWSGMRLRAPLADGEVLAARSVVPAGAVRRGDRVRLVVDAAPLRIETAAVAQEDGMAGARVRVMPAAGGEAVAARVVGPGVVAIEGL